MQAGKVIKTTIGALPTERNGDSTKQKDALVQAILDAFLVPEKFPMTDGERCDFLRGLYRSARTIRATEAAESQIK
jgi:hypothetical protein